jgi:hypothetical protein
MTAFEFSWRSLKSIEASQLLPLQKPTKAAIFEFLKGKNSFSKNI